MSISIINTVNTYNVSTYDVSNKWKFLGRIPVAYTNDISFVLRGEYIDTSTFKSNLDNSFVNTIMMRVISISLPTMSLETTEITHLSFNSKMQSKPTLGDEITVTIVEDANSKVFLNFKDFITTYYNWVSQVSNNPNYSIKFHIDQFLTPLTTTTNTNYVYLSTSTNTSRNDIDSITTVSNNSNNLTTGTLGTRIFRITLHNPIIKNLNHQTMDYSSTEQINREITIGFEYFEFIMNKSDGQPLPLF